MHKEKNVLVICEYFAPLNSIASVRFTKILKYLVRTHKYHFVVVARKSDDLADGILQRDLDEMNDDIDVFYIDVMDNWIDRKRKRRNNVTVPSDKSSDSNAKKFKPYSNATFFEKIYKFVNTVKYIYNERIFVKRGLRVIESIDLDFECMISSYGDAGAHLLAQAYKDKHKSIRWIADYRDPAITYYRPPFFNFFFDKIIDFTIKNAECITGVTYSALGRCYEEEKSLVIINGFDKDDLDMIEESDLVLEESKFHICYTGRIYEGKSDARYLFKALKLLSDTRQLDLCKIQIDYAGSNYDLLIKQANEYGLSNLVKNRGFLLRKDALALQQQANLLLVLSWHDEEEEDVLTGKFMEYLMAGNNILAIVTGNKTDCSIYKILFESNAGFCFEEARGDAGYSDFVEYLFSMYTEWNEMGKNKYEGITEYLDRFNYSNIANEYEQLIMGQF